MLVLVKKLRLVNLVFVALVTDIPSDQLFVQTDGRDEVASSPEGAFSVTKFVEFLLLSKPSRGFAFDDAHGVGDRKLRRQKKDKMKMVVLDIQFDHFPAFPLADQFQNSSQFFLEEVIVQDGSAVARSPDTMVFTVPEAMR